MSNQQTQAWPRNPCDGHPHYCVRCDRGYLDFLRCARKDCELESQASAAARAIPIGKNHGRWPASVSHRVYRRM